MRETLPERVLLLVGFLAVGIGVVLTVPGAGTVVRSPESIVPLLGVLALVQAVRTASDFWTASRRDTDLADAHRTRSATAAGEEFDRALDLTARRGQIGRRNRERLERTLHRAVVETIAAETGESRDVVGRRVDEGTWTDDPVAAALFTRESTPPWGDRIRRLLGRETTFECRVNRAVTALDRRVSGVDDA